MPDFSRRWGLLLAAGSVVSLLLSACAPALRLSTASPDSPDGVRRIAASGAARDSRARGDKTLRPLILIPGFQGSTLLDGPSGRRVWGAFAGDYAQPDRAEGRRLLALPMQTGVPLEALRDSVAADGLLSRFRFKLLRLLPVYVDGYNNLVRALEAEGYRFEPLDAPRADTAPPDAAPPDAAPCYNGFIFTYDWRRSSDENAWRLSAFVQEKRALLERQPPACRSIDGLHGSEEMRFDLVAHSMGALVARYFLRYGDQPLPETGSLPPVTWAGARQVHEAVLIAPPNAGSLPALEALVEGRTYLPGVGRFEPAVLGTLPALYELLPRAGGGRVVLGGYSADGR